MKLTLPAGRHRIDCEWSHFGREVYRVGGREVLRRWSFSPRGRRSFMVDSEKLDVDVDLGKARSVQVFVDGRLAHTETLPPRKAYQVTLLELLIACAIIGILAAIAIPPDHGAPRYFINNVHGAAQDFEKLSGEIISFRSRTGKWPAANADIGFPANGLKRWEDRHVFNVQPDGSVLLDVHAVCYPQEKHCKPGERYEFGKVSFRPAVNERGDVAFVCGHERAPDGYKAVGQNRTTLRGSELPGRCR